MHKVLYEYTVIDSPADESKMKMPIGIFQKAQMSAVISQLRNNYEGDFTKGRIEAMIQKVLDPRLTLETARSIIEDLVFIRQNTTNAQIKALADCFFDVFIRFWPDCRYLISGTIQKSPDHW